MKHIHLYIMLFALVVLNACKGNQKSDSERNTDINKGHEHYDQVNQETSHENTHAHKEHKSEVNTHDDSVKHEGHGENEEHEGHGEEHSETLSLTREQLDVLGIGIGEVPLRNMEGFIEVNGKIEVPPQNEAVITTSLGANILSIQIIEGQEVKKGQILAYITHPDIISIQTEYLEAYNKLSFLEQDYARQEKLYRASVGSGRDFQKAKSEYLTSEVKVKGYESQLILLGLKPRAIVADGISSAAPLKSTIKGFVEKVYVKTGQYVQPQTALFEIVNTEHIHADLMVFEKDISKVKNGQKVKFSIKSSGREELEGEIFSLGKSIEQGPKAMHIHAEIDGHFDNLIVGMYVKARILIDENKEQALPEEAFFKDGKDLFVFKVMGKNNETVAFSLLEVIEKKRSMGYVSFIFKEKQTAGSEFAKGGAYYLMSELKKSEAEHSH